VSYQIVTALSGIGCILKRNAYIDQVNWKVFPNLSLLLVGPSGIGKDTAIDAIEDVLADGNLVQVLGGKTIETIHELMLGIGDPACAYIPAPEITAFLGGKDYQKSMVQELTHLLTTKNYVDVTTKSQLAISGKRRIPHPTVTLHAGSTEEWLHKAMPEGSMEGGLWPRFLIISEQYGSKRIPLLKLLPKDEVRLAQRGREKFLADLQQIAEVFSRKPGEVFILADAADVYTNWYENRFRLFSKTVQPYANRSRDQVLRLAMLCAVSRMHDYIEEIDMQFAVEVMAYVAKTIDKVMRPPTREATIAREIVKLLPCTKKDVTRVLGMNFSIRDLAAAETYLVQSGQMSARDGVWYLANDQEETT
jgi:energy-coupling factor transporter ATP-binding protein EcfA2